jgi:hypothetical protein
MGSHFGWVPVSIHEGGNIDTPLKAALAEEFTNGDTTALHDHEFGREALPWLRGVAAGGSQTMAADASELVAAIEKHGHIRTIHV